jgi:uncharacterized protein with NAD-binding domain and iron-sulfur cluster
LRGGTATAERVISAVPHHAAPQLLPPGVYSPEAANELGSSPIVNAYLHYDRRVLDAPFAAVVDSQVQWLFDRTETSEAERGQLLALSYSAADGEVKLPQERIVADATQALARILPRTVGANLLGSWVTREPRATFRAAPGSARLRPGARTSVPGLALAGAWTDTGWPATMEGAVRSGLAAAQVVLAQPRAAGRRKEVLAS